MAWGSPGAILLSGNYPGTIRDFGVAWLASAGGGLGGGVGGGLGVGVGFDPLVKNLII